MIRKANSVKTSILLVVATCHLAPAQQPTVTTLTVDLANQVEYQADISDPTKFARNANTTPSLGNGTGILNFGVATILGDIVAVNGQPAKGFFALPNIIVFLSIVFIFAGTTFQFFFDIS